MSRLKLREIAKAVQSIRAALQECDRALGQIEGTAAPGTGGYDDPEAAAENLIKTSFLNVLALCERAGLNSILKQVESDYAAARKTGFLKKGRWAEGAYFVWVERLEQYIGGVAGGLGIAEDHDTANAPRANWTFSGDGQELRARNEALCREYAAMGEQDLLAISSRWRGMAIDFTETTKRSGGYHGHVVHDDEVMRVTKLLETAVAKRGIEGVDRLGRCLRRPDTCHLHWALATLDELDAKLRAESVAQQARPNKAKRTPKRDKATELGKERWSKPHGLKEWSSVYNKSVTTMRRWFRGGNIANEQVSPRQWKVSIDDLPDGYEKNRDFVDTSEDRRHAHP